MQAVKDAVRASIAGNVLVQRAKTKKVHPKRGRMLAVNVRIPILSRGSNHKKKGISNNEIARTVSYVLNIFLQRYCAGQGGPKFGPIAANGKVQEVDD